MLKAVVVLPPPPFWLATAVIRQLVRLAPLEGVKSAVTALSGIRWSRPSLVSRSLSVHFTYDHLRESLKL